MTQPIPPPRSFFLPEDDRSTATRAEVQYGFHRFAINATVLWLLASGGFEKLVGQDEHLRDGGATWLQKLIDAVTAPPNVNDADECGRVAGLADHFFEVLEQANQPYNPDDSKTFTFLNVLRRNTAAGIGWWNEVINDRARNPRAYESVDALVRRLDERTSKVGGTLSYVLQHVDQLRHGRTTTASTHGSNPLSSSTTAESRIVSAARDALHSLADDFHLSTIYTFAIEDLRTILERRGNSLTNWHQEHSPPLDIASFAPRIRPIGIVKTRPQVHAVVRVGSSGIPEVPAPDRTEPEESSVRPCVPPLIDQRRPKPHPVRASRHRRIARRAWRGAAAFAMGFMAALWAARDPNVDGNPSDLAWVSPPAAVQQITTPPVVSAGEPTIHGERGQTPIPDGAHGNDAPAGFDGARRGATPSESTQPAGGVTTNPGPPASTAPTTPTPTTPPPTTSPTPSAPGQTTESPPATMPPTPGPTTEAPGMPEATAGTASTPDPSATPVLVQLKAVVGVRNRSSNTRWLVIPSTGQQRDDHMGLHRDGDVENRTVNSDHLHRPTHPDDVLSLAFELG